MKYNYYVVYHTSDSLGYKHFSLDHLIETIDDVYNLSRTISEEEKDGQQVIITNWIELKGVEG